MIKYLIEFIKKNVGKTALIFLLDMLFYLFLLLIPYYSLNLFMEKAKGINYKLLGTLTQPGTADEVLNNLLGILFDFLSVILFFIFLLILNFAIFKGLVWLLTLKKKITWKKLSKFFLIKLILDLIFLIPFILTIVPIVNKTYISEIHNPEIPLLSDLIPMMILTLIFIYFATLSFYFLAKENSIWKSLKLTFTKSFTKLGITAVPFLVYFASMLLSINLGINIFIILVLSLVISFANRIYLVESKL